MTSPPVPFDEVAEQILLGNCLLQESAAPVAGLTAEHFFSSGHKVILAAILDLRDQGVPVNFREISERAETLGLSAVSPAWTGIMDGIPLLHDGSLEHYRERLEMARRKRETLRAASDLAMAIEHGEPAEAVAARAAEVAEISKPRETGARKDDQYPRVSEDAWYGPAKLYRQAVAESTEASDNFHLACFLTSMGCLLGRMVYVRKGRVTYPNLYTVLVGKSGGARKGTAMSLAIDNILNIDSNVVTTETMDSREGFIADLAASQRTLSDAGYSKELRVTLCMEEFRSFIEKAAQKGTSNLAPELCVFYDCPRRRQNRSKNNPAEVREPTLSVLAGTSPTFLENLTLGDIAGGVGNRVCWVPGDRKARKDNPPDPNFGLMDGIKVLLAEVLEFYRLRGVTRLEMSPDAAIRYKKFYEKEYNPPTKDEVITVLSERDDQTCLKVSMIYAALSKADRYIELHHLEPAIRYVEFLYESRFPIFAGHGLSPAGQIDFKIVEKMKAAGRPGMSYRTLQQSIRTDAETFHRRMRALAPEQGDGILKIQLVGGAKKRRWVFVND
jgi:DnaB-like helicase N terminal domain